MGSNGPSPNAITDRVIIPVKGSVDDWKEPFKNLLLTLKAQPGYIRTRWGPRSEDMNTIDLMIGWNSPEDKDTFMASEAHSKAMEQMKPVLGGQHLSYTIKFKPYAPREAIDAPIVEMITITNCTGNEDDLRASIEKAYKQPGARGGACGFSTAEVEGHGKIFVAAIGWDGIDASKASDKSYVPSGAGNVETHHVNYNFPIKGFSVTNSD